MSENIGLRLWKRVEKTDKSITKSVGYGTYKYTAIDAYHQFRNATEQFGPYGIGWGVTNESFEEFTAGLLIYRAEFWYKYDGTIGGSFPISAGRKIYKTVKETEVLDSEIFKSIRTDALTKALSMIGFNADVFMGVFDGRIDDSEPTTSRQKATTGKTTTKATQSTGEGLNTSKAIWFGNKTGTPFCDLSDGDLEWVHEKGFGEAVDLAKAVLAERKAPELPVNGGGNIMAEDNNPMTAKEIAELDKLFEVNYDSAFWNDFKETRPESMTFGLFKKFKASLLGAAEAGVEFDQIEQRIAEAMRESGV